MHFTGLQLRAILRANTDVLHRQWTGVFFSAGLGMFLSYQVAALRKSGRLKYVLEQFEPEPIPVHVVYAHSNLLSNRMHAFIDDCVEKLRQTKFE